MATFSTGDRLGEWLADKILDLNADTIRWALTNSAPTDAMDDILDITQIATGGGYTQFTDGASTFNTSNPTVSFSRSTGTTTVSASASVLTASAAVATFRYVVLVDDTVTVTGMTAPAVANVLLGWFDHGSAITMAITDTYTIPSGAVFTVVS
jgi:hypothetical protein